MVGGDHVVEALVDVLEHRGLCLRHLVLPRLDRIFPGLAEEKEGVRSLLDPWEKAAATGTVHRGSGDVCL